MINDLLVKWVNNSVIKLINESLINWVNNLVII